MPENIISFIFSFVILLVFFGVLDVILLMLIRKNVKWPALIGAAVIYFTVIFGGIYLMSRNVPGQDLGTVMISQFNSQSDAFVFELKKAGASAQDIQSFRQMYDLFFIKLLPGLMFLSVVFMAFLNYFVVRLFAYQRYGIKNEIPSFELWHLNEPVIWALIASALAIIANNIIPFKWIYYAAINVLTVVANFYMVIGTAIVSFYLKKFKAPGFFRAITYLFIIFAAVVFPAFILLVTILGVFDTWFNFRKIQKEGYQWK